VRDLARPRETSQDLARPRKTSRDLAETSQDLARPREVSARSCEVSARPREVSHMPQRKSRKETICCGETSRGALSTAALHRRHRGHHSRCSRAPFARGADRTATWNASWRSSCTAISADNQRTEAKSRRGPRPGGSRLCRPDLQQSLLRDARHRASSTGAGRLSAVSKR